MHNLLFCLASVNHHMIYTERSGSPGPKDLIAMRPRVKNKISRLYDKPLVSSLTALAIMAASIFISITLS